MLSECINDFFKKYKKYIFIICIIFAILILWKLSNAQENINDTTSDTTSDTNSDNKNETTVGGFILYSCLVLNCVCLIPWIILYYITRASARAAIKTTSCQSIGQPGAELNPA
jgi:hypothetical protein